jgi:hypothetical protein
MHCADSSHFDPVTWYGSDVAKLERSAADASIVPRVRTGEGLLTPLAGLMLDHCSIEPSRCHTCPGR